MRFDPADGHLDVINTSVLVPSAGAIVAGGRSWLQGWTLTAAAAATPVVVNLFDGVDGNGDLFAVLRIAADATSTQSQGFPGRPIESGLFVTTSGPVVVGSFLLGVKL